MKTSLLLSALFFLLSVAFSTQTLNLAEEYVLDLNGNHLKPGNNYHILDAENLNRGIEIGKAFHEKCAVTVTIGIDAKKVLFYHSEDHKDATGIKVGETTDLEFAEVSPCAESGKWNVSVHGHKKYPVVIGPPEGAITMNGTFHISKSEDITDAYNIAFKFYGVDDYVLVASTHEHGPEIYSVVFCRPGRHYKNFNVKFQLADIIPPTPSPPPPTPSPPPPTPSPPPPTPSPPPPTPSPPPPTPSPPPPSPTPTPSPPPPSPTFVPLIRKVVRSAE